MAPEANDILGSTTAVAVLLPNKNKARHEGLRPFVAGDSRINRRGRPKGFDEFRRLAQKISHEKITLSNGNMITVVEAILRSWAKSKEPQLQKAFIEYCYGKPPEKVEAAGLAPTTILRLHYAHEERPDGRLGLS